MPSIKERIEQNLTIWLLSTLLAGFLAGMGAFKTIQEIGGLTSVSKSAVVEQQKTIDDLMAKSAMQQETIDLLDKRIGASLVREDSLKRVYETEIATAKKQVVVTASKLNSAFKSIRNNRVCIKHLPSQAAAANRLALLLDKYNAITEVSVSTYDRGYWSVMYRNTNKDPRSGA